MVASFLQSLGQGLPSSSTDATGAVSPLATELEELVVDTLWTVDTEMDDVELDSVDRESVKKNILELIKHVLVRLECSTVYNKI